MRLPTVCETRVSFVPLAQALTRAAPERRPPRSGRFGTEFSGKAPASPLKWFDGVYKTKNMVVLPFGPNVAVFREPRRGETSSSHLILPTPIARC